MVYRITAFTLLVALIGTGLELLLIGHFEDPTQLIPLILIIFSFILFLILLWKKITRVAITFRFLMTLIILSGFLGIWFHFKSNMEFEKEMYPTLTNWDLIKGSLTGALPALAPGSMIVIGLLGYMFLLVNPANSSN